MGQIVKLAEVVERLAELDGEDTIYASEPWTEASDAIVAPDPEPERVEYRLRLE